MFNGTITGVGSPKPFKYPSIPLFFIFIDINKKVTINARQTVVFKSAVGDLKAGKISNTPFFTPNQGIGKNVIMFDKNINKNNVAKNV
jgi:hypothetical protein